MTNDPSGDRMRKVICCWCGKRAEDFERHVPLLFSGRRNLRLGFDNDIDIVFLKGYDVLPESYRQSLKDVGYALHDAGKPYQRVAEKYAILDRFGDYEKKCFLRWLVISSHFPGEPILHFDGDILFNEAPAVIARLLQGRTFVLQGCPALTCIADRTWFDLYQEQLNRFVADIEAYSAKAWTERDGWEISAEKKWAGQRFREIISSDQDLISHLIHTDRIVQDRPDQVLNHLESYIVFENPLYLHGYENGLHQARYSRTSGIDYIDGRRVLVWHMQGYFKDYLGRFLFRKRFFPRSVKRLNLGDSNKDLCYHLHDFFIRHLHGKTNMRLNVYRYFFEEGDFSEVFTDKTWWQEGAFA